MSRAKWLTILVAALRVIITLLFAPAILVKLQNPGVWAHQFTRWGYPAWGALAVSGAEIIGLIAIWSPFAMAATVVLMITLTGATGTWLVHGPRMAAIYPGLLLVLVVSLSLLERHRRRGGA